MKIRRKFLFYLASFMLFLAIALAVVSHWILDASFGGFEKKDLAAEISRVAADCDDTLDDMLATAGDWAAWDDTYEYVNGRKPSYEADNLTPVAFARIRLNAMFFYDVRGALVGSRYVDLGDGQQRVISPELKDALLEYPKLVRQTDEKGRTKGFLRVGNAVYYAVSIPILHSDASGPVAGTLVLLRQFNSLEIERVGKKEQVTFYLDPVVPGDPELSSRREDTELEGGRRASIRFVGWQKIAASMLLRDLEGRPAAILEIEKPREIYALGRTAIYSGYATFIVVTLLSALVFAWALERAFLRRIARLSDAVGKLGENADEVARLTFKGEEQDEVFQLGAAVQNLVGLERLRARELRESEMRHRALFDHAGDGIFLLHADGEEVWKIEASNPAVDRLYGYGPGELVGKHVSVILPDNATSLPESMIDTIRRGEWVVVEGRHKRCDGSVFPVEVSAGLLALDDRRYVLGFVRDATRRKQTETALRDSEALYRGLLGAWPDPTIIYDPTGAVTYVNESFEHTYGFAADEVLGRRLDMIVPAEEAGAAVGTWRQLLETGRAETLEARRKTRDGRVLIVKINVSILRDAKGRHVASLAIHRDVTKQREAEQRNRLLEERSRHSQKIESLGVLAGGIAHDFNNLLTPIIGFTELAIDDVRPEGNTRQNLEHVVVAAERARDLVSQILVFSREDVDEVCPVRLSQTVRETIHLLRASLPATIRIEKEFEECPDVVLANPTQLHQIVMNLATNASHAMEPHGGLLSLCVRSASAGDLERMGFSAGNYVIVSVADTGRGIPPEIRDRIFDPFFTTKGVGEGTGMGLSMVHGITRQMGGAVVFETEVGKGTRFDVCLPLHSGEVAQRPEGAEDYPVRPGRILLADDEEMIVDFWRQALLRMGYVVEAATVAVDALAKFEADPDGFDLVITDQTMPQMTGTEFAKRILEMRPDIPIILCTGYSKTITPEEILAAGIREFLTKPITVQQMAVAIHRVMSGGAAENSAATGPSLNRLCGEAQRTS